MMMTTTSSDLHVLLDALGYWLDRGVWRYSDPGVWSECWQTDDGVVCVAAGTVRRRWLVTVAGSAPWTVIADAVTGTLVEAQRLVGLLDREPF
jgi:hypothetical protein